MATNNPSSTIVSGRITFACIRCAERKVKCDRQRPCSACTKHNVECIFNTTKPPRKKYKRVKVQALADRLSQYENLLREYGVDTSSLPGSVTTASACATATSFKETLSSTEEADGRIQIENGHFVPPVHGTGHVKFVEK